MKDPPGGTEMSKRDFFHKIKEAEGDGLGKVRGQGGFFESKGVVFHGGFF